MVVGLLRSFNVVKENFFWKCVGTMLSITTHMFQLRYQPWPTASAAEVQIYTVTPIMEEPPHFKGKSVDDQILRWASFLPVRVEERCFAKPPVRFLWTFAALAMMSDVANIFLCAQLLQSQRRPTLPVLEAVSKRPEKQRQRIRGEFVFHWRSLQDWLSANCSDAVISL